VNLYGLPSLDELRADPARVAELPARVASDLLAEVEGELVRAQRLRDSPLLRAAIGDGPRRRSSGDGDEILEIEEAAHRLGRSPRWLYANHRGLPFVLQDGKRCRLRFSATGIDRYIRERRGL
jgi:hypothetical protein